MRTPLLLCLTPLADSMKNLRPSLLVASLVSLHLIGWAGPRLDETVFFVSPSGDDRWSGTIAGANPERTDGPFATLTRARDAIRQLKFQQGLQQPVKVQIRGGIYSLTEPLRLWAGDSGTPQYPIRYQAYPGEKPILRGSKPITNWQPFKGQILRAYLPEVRRGQWWFRQLFFGGKRMTRARHPNFDPADPLYGGWAFVQAAVDEQDSTRMERIEAPVAFRYEDGVFPHRWAKPQAGEVFIIPGNCWINDIIPIRSVDAEARTIHLTRTVNASRNTLGGATHVREGNRFYVENNLEDLDTPGEWSLDRETGMLYFWPPKGGVSSADVTAPYTSRLVQMIGTQAAPVRHIILQGLTFTQTLAEFPSGNEYYKTPNAGQALYLESAEDSSIQNNTFTAVGGDAIRLQNNNARIRITGNEIAEPGSNGIFIGSFQRGHSRHDTFSGDVPSPTEWFRDRFDQDVTLQQWPRSTDHLIQNNHIHHVGQIEKHTSGIVFFGVVGDGSILSHNLIHDSPRFGIGLLSGFGRVIVEYNHLHHLSLETADTGAVTVNRWYTYDRDPGLRAGNVFRFNRIHDTIGAAAYGKTLEAGGEHSKAGGRILVPYYSWSLYFDNAPMDVLVHGNITARDTLGGIMVSHYCRNVTVENNIFLDSDRSQAYLLLRGEMENVRFRRNIFSYRNPTAKFMRLNVRETQKVVQAVVTEFDRNLYHLPAGAVLTFDSPASPPDAAGWRAWGYDRNSLFADPKFKDSSKGDYSLGPDSPALTLGFQPIDSSKIGLLTKTVGAGGSEK
ncbi:MAG: hypothetical protein ACKV22_31580 [Bryobacteraceae bacterium]